MREPPQAGEPTLAVLDGLPADILAVPFQQVERAQDRAAVAAVAPDQIEHGQAVVVQTKASPSPKLMALPLSLQQPNHVARRWDIGPEKPNKRVGTIVSHFQPKLLNFLRSESPVGSATYRLFSAFLGGRANLSARRQPASYSLRTAYPSRPLFPGFC
jgi:hypothetical protein